MAGLPGRKHTTLLHAVDSTAAMHTTKQWAEEDSAAEPHLQLAVAHLRQRLACDGTVGRQRDALQVVGADGGNDEAP